MAASGSTTAPAMAELYPAIREDPFVPHPLLRGGHLQTVAASLLPRRALPPGETRIVYVDDTTRLLCRFHWQPERHKKGALVVVHGMGGSSEAGPVLGLTRRALDAGLSVVRFNMRGCGDSTRLSTTLYHSNLPEDLRAVLRELASEGVPRIVLAAYSLGANLVLNTLADLGADAPPELAGAALVCPCIDIAAAAARIAKRENALYESTFLRELRAYYLRKAGAFPERYRPEALQGARTLRAFDDLVTAPAFGFPSADAYYAWVSSAPRLGRVRVPFLAIQSDDDPFVQLQPETRRALLESPFAELFETKGGGHCAFLAKPTRRIPDGRWAEHHVVALAASLAHPPG